MDAAAQSAARKVEHVLDQVGNPARAAMHHRESTAAMFRQRFPLQNEHTVDDRTQRTAQIMPEYRDELLAEISCFPLGIQYLPEGRLAGLTELQLARELPVQDIEFRSRLDRR